MYRSSVLTATVAAIAAACLATSAEATFRPRPATLYERLGGLPAIRAVVDFNRKGRFLYWSER